VTINDGTAVKMYRIGADQNVIRDENFWCRIFGIKFDRKYSIVLLVEHGGTDSTCTFVNYLFLLLCLYIPIVMCVVFCTFHRANWHSSAILTGGFPRFLLSCKANARV